MPLFLAFHAGPEPGRRYWITTHWRLPAGRSTWKAGGRWLGGLTAMLGVLNGQFPQLAQSCATTPSWVVTPAVLCHSASSALVTPAAPCPALGAGTTVPVKAAQVAPTPWHFRTLRTEPAVHHYLGLIGGAHASAELSWKRPDSVAGTCYLWRGGPEYHLTAASRHRRGALLLAVSQEVANIARACGTWHLTTPLGPVLRGTWVDSAGRQRPSTLREDYRQAVPYALQSLTLTGSKVPRKGCPVSRITREYLYLRGRRPALQRLLAPPLAARQLLADEPAGESTYSLLVRLNDFQLLSYETFHEAYPADGPRQNSLQSSLFDLTTGRALPLASQLQPGYEPALRRLLIEQVTRDLQHVPSALTTDGSSARPAWPIPSTEPPLHSLVLTGAGLEAAYFEGELDALLGPAVDVRAIPYTLLIPYARLRPLVRPGTPLARMLAARGLW